MDISLIYGLLLILIISSGGWSCEFEGLLASCRMAVGGIPIQVSARVNHCHNPVDITFLMRSPRFYNVRNPDKEPISWEYTFVTTNQPESKEIPGYGRRIMLHLYANNEVHTKLRRLSVKAQFLVDGQTNDKLTFLRETITIPHFDDCRYAHRNAHITKVAVGCFIFVIILCISGISIVGLIRRKKVYDDDEVNLVNNMERTSRSHRHHHQPQADSVFYVVPKEDALLEDENELKVYVSTPNGLKKVSRQPSQNSDRSSNLSTGGKSTHSKSQPTKETSLTVKDDETKQNSSSLEEEEVNENPFSISPSVSSSSSSSSSPKSDSRSLGAIPKWSANKRPSSSSSSSSSAPSR